MIVEVHTPDATWSLLPASFPTPDGLGDAEWFAGVSERYAGTQGGLEAEAVGALRSAIDAARTEILPGDLVTMLYRPARVPVTAIVHVQMIDIVTETEESLRWAMMPDVEFALPPIVEDFDAPALGRGRKAAFILAEGFDDDVTASGLTYAIPVADVVVFVFTSPNTPTVVGLLEAELDDIVRSIRIRDDDPEE